MLVPRYAAHHVDHDLNPEKLHVNPASTHAVRVAAGADMLYIGGQNGIDSAGNVGATDLPGQARQALANLQECLAAAGRVSSTSSSGRC